MTKTITAAKATIDALATTLDQESRLPYASEPCVCGAKPDARGVYPVAVVDRYAQTVRCAACGKVSRATDRAATIQVRAVAVAKDGAASYPCDAALEARIVDAKAKPSKDRTPTEAALAAVPAPVAVEPAPIPKEGRTP